MDFFELNSYRIKGVYLLSLYMRLLYTFYVVQHTTTANPPLSLLLSASIELKTFPFA